MHQIRKPLRCSRKNWLRLGKSLRRWSKSLQLWKEISSRFLIMLRKITRRWWVFRRRRKLLKKWSLSWSRRRLSWNRPSLTQPKTVKLTFKKSKPWKLQSPRESKTFKRLSSNLQERRRWLSRKLPSTNNSTRCSARTSLNWNSSRQILWTNFKKNKMSSPI